MGPLVFLILIDDLKLDLLTHKYVDAWTPLEESMVDDTTLSEVMGEKTR